MFSIENGGLLRTFAGERLLIEPWGKDALRVRGTMYAKFDAEHWALADVRPPGAADIRIDDGGESASIRGDKSAITTAPASYFWLNTDPSFRECLVRWFQFSVFSPVLRMHGDREPHRKALSDRGGGLCISGADNEIWSFGEEVETILVSYLRVRERLRPYLREQMRRAHEHGTPLMRPLCYDFPDDDHAWQIDDAYMFGPDILVAPVLFEGTRQRTLYLPAGCRWRNQASGEVAEGGQKSVADAPLARIPLFLREGSAADTLLA